MTLRHREGIHRIGQAHSVIERHSQCSNLDQPGSSVLAPNSYARTLSRLLTTWSCVRTGSPPGMLCLTTLLDCRELLLLNCALKRFHVSMQRRNLRSIKLKLQYFGHLMQRVDSLEKTLMLGGFGDRKRRG